jgi:hypothetical protein
VTTLRWVPHYLRAMQGTMVDGGHYDTVCVSPVRLAARGGPLRRTETFFLLDRQTVRRWPGWGGFIKPKETKVLVAVGPHHRHLLIKPFRKT